jgi:hypothetical protein
VIIVAEYICFVKRENARKAEEALRQNFDVAAKQSITIRDAGVLGVKDAGDGSFFYVTGTDDGVKRCRELIKDFIFTVKPQLLDKAKTKIKEEEEAAAAGFGGIFG